MFGVENIYALAGALIFAASVPVTIYFLKRYKDGFGDFSTGVSYLDFYSAIILIVPLVAASSYLFMAFGFGIVQSGGELVHWLRYYEWALSTPLLVLGTLLLTQERQLMLKGMFADFLMIMTGFLAEMATVTSHRIVLFSISSALFVYLIYLVVFRASRIMEDSVESFKALFNRLKLITVGLWIAYPLLWVAGPDLFNIFQEQLLFQLFLILDLTAKIGYSTFIVLSVSEINSSSPGKWG